MHRDYRIRSSNSFVKLRPRNYCSLPGFNEQLAGSGNGLNIRDEVEPGVSKSSVRYVSTSPEGWIGRGNKMGARSRGLVRLKGGRPGGWW